MKIAYNGLETRMFPTKYPPTARRTRRGRAARIAHGEYEINQIFNDEYARLIAT